MKKVLPSVAFGAALILATVLAGCTGEHSTSELSPSGTPSSVRRENPAGLIVFQGHPSGPYSSIYTMKPDGTALTRLTPTPPGDNDFHPWLSPDGSQIVFARYVHGNHITSTSTAPEHDVLMVANTDGSGLHELIPACPDACAKGCALATLPCPAADYPSWSPDGTRIAFERSYGPDIQHLTVAIWVANADGGHAKQLTQPRPGFEDHSPSWSPDSRHLVFDRFDDRAFNGGQGNIYTIGADGHRLRLIFRAPSRWPFGGAKPRWSPDGSRILFSEFCWFGSKEGCPADTPETGAHLFTIRPDGGGLTELTHGSMNELFPAWSPDGGWIVFSRGTGLGDSDGSPEMYLMRANGTDVRPIASSGCPCLGEWGAAPVG